MGALAYGPHGLCRRSNCFNQMSPAIQRRLIITDGMAARPRSAVRDPTA